MRALFLHDAAAWDGGARVFATVALALSRRGDEAWLAVPEASEASREAARHGVPLLLLEPRRWAPSRARELRALAPRGFVDVLFVHRDHEHLAAALAVRGARRGGIVRRVGAGERPELGWRGRRAGALVPTRLLFTTESPPTGHAAPSGELAPMRAELGVVAAPRLDGDQTDTPPAPAGVVRDASCPAPVLACIASRDSVRRATNVVRAAALLSQRHRELRLRVLGSVAADEELKLLAAALGIARRVEWIGHPGPDGAALRGVAAGWVVANGDEAALGALDLMAHGVAVLAERTSSAARYVNHGIHGTLMTSLDPPLMAAETAMLLSDRGRRDTMGAAGRARVEREFPLREMLAGFEHAARAALERHRGRA